MLKISRWIVSLALSVSLSSAIALAMPAVSDSASFDLVVTMQGMEIPGKLTLDLTAFDAAKGQFNRRSVTAIMGQSQTENEWVNATDFMNDANMDQVLQHCATVNGKVESLTVPAGTFTTCAVVQAVEGGIRKTWLGKVPFGIVKSEATNADGTQKTSVTLTGYHRG